MRNVHAKQQPLPAGGMTCPHCCETTIPSPEDLRRAVTKYVEKHGTAVLARALGSLPSVRSAVADSSGLRTPPASPSTQATRRTPPAPQTPPEPQTSPARQTPPTHQTPPAPQNSQLREDGIWKLDPLLGPRRLRGTGVAHWLRLGMGGRHPLHAGRLAARGAAFHLHRGARDLALVPSEHGLAFFFADGLAEGAGDRDELFRRASEIAQCHGGLTAYPLDPDTGAQREKPLLAFSCSNSGRGRSEVLVNGLRGWLVERYPLKVVHVQTWYRALSSNRLRPLRGRFITETVRSPAPAPEMDYAALAEFRSWFLPLPDDWLRRAPRGSPREDGWLANAEIWAEFERAFEAWGLPLDRWTMTKLALRMRAFPPLGTTRMLGSGNAKRRGRYGLAWRGHPGSLLLRP